MANGFEAVDYPELVFGIAGAIGIDIVEINKALAEALQAVGYNSHQVHITHEIADEVTNVPRPAESDFGSEVSYKMSHASEVCRKFGSPDTLMRFAIRRIQAHRAEIATLDPTKASYPGDDVPLEEQVVPRAAYIIRQLKRPEEVRLLRKIYGKQFILLSAYASAESRRRILEVQLKRSMPLNTPDHVISSRADQLIHRDQNEDTDHHGQHLRNTFHMADVFFDGVSKTEMTATLTRFINALFGKADVSPTRAEYGMYAAKAASFRSADLARQVGAAIFTPDGELITQGCNEVPKAFGGTYWEGDEPDCRDVKLGHDPNDVLKREVVRDFLERLSRSEMLSEKALKIGGAADIVDALLRPAPPGAPEGYGSLADSAVMELTEYGRVVHAEMCAICDAARLGRSLKGAILYCTTFPCHNCTKHLLAAGIAQVIYMEPYPKSKAKELHQNEIEIEKQSLERVSFMPFLGISPVRYRDIFEKGKRKKDGVALDWMRSRPMPLIDLSAPAYVGLESFEMARLGAAFAAKKSEIPVGED